MSRPVVALVTDFGVRDHYAGTMKGVVLSVCPDATLVDLTHDIPPQDVLAAALELSWAYTFFPPATVFLTVVDPGVGSARRALAAAAGGYFFVGPDNGVFSLVFRESPPERVVELAERRFARSAISATFEGRDRFAPAAGWIARGTPLDAFGPVVKDPHALALPVAASDGNSWQGEIIHVDRFGNLITNIAADALRHLAPARTRVRIGAREIAGLVATYAAVAPGELCALAGSSGLLEIAVRQGSAAAQLGASRGTPVTVTGG